jgi:hypothetical protein
MKWLLRLLRYDQWDVYHGADQLIWRRMNLDSLKWEYREMTAEELQDAIEYWEVR